MKNLGPFRLAPYFSERPWGRTDLRPWYGQDLVQPVGEAWLNGPESVIETGALKGETFQSMMSGAFWLPQGGTEFPLLIKLLFPREKLSVQVHPDDAHARRMGAQRGKTECWYVLEAETGAQIALGMRPNVTPATIRAAIADHSLEELLHWIPVAKGDMVFVDAGTVHAIGPGMVLLETQQTCDITFRMYDYGRPRPLHVEQALEVLRVQTAAGKVAPTVMDGFTRLIQQDYFVVDRYELPSSGSVTIDSKHPACLVALDGKSKVTTRGYEPVELVRGHGIIVPTSGETAVIEGTPGSIVVRCWAP